jgi:Ca-activated chloride channel homolog
MIRTILTACVAVMLAIPSVALAQVIDPMPPIPCPWWDCGASNHVVVEEYRLETTIDNSIATTKVTQILRNDGPQLAEGEFLHPIPSDAAVTGLTLWIDGQPVAGELLDGDVARRTYEEIVRRTLDPALLEFADDGLLRLDVFPIAPGDTRTVQIEYRQVLTVDGGLVRYQQSLGREHGNVAIERVVASVDIIDSSELKTIYSPTHAVAIERIDESTASVGFEESSDQTSNFTLYYSTDQEAVAIDVLSFRDGNEGWFLLLASPGLAAPDAVTAKDVVVVVDVSGSMEGEKIVQAQDAATFVLEHLNPDDRFQVIAFSNAVQSFEDGLVSTEYVGAAQNWVGQLGAAGATDINRALETAFSLADSERPLYVVFLTDGLPTEGLIDTAEILDNLDRKGGDTTSLFAFGVGFDVDTVLLDTLAADHHGTTSYVVPGENIDETVSALYSKVSSPVLTDVRLAIDGVVVSDLHPSPLPDIFSGGQMVIAGRYDGWGPATVTVEGRMAGEEVEITYDDIRFTAAGGDPAVPGLWATRKIGALLRNIRLHGPNDETIDQIVRISIRHGIVTPYTSFLVTEPAPFGADAIDVISRDAIATTTTVGASGEASVTAADAAAEMSASDFAAAPSEMYRDTVVIAGGRTMRESEGVWIDTTYDPNMAHVRVAFGSPDYFTLSTASDSVAAAMSVGAQVIVVVDGVAFAVVGADADSDPLPAIAAETTETAPTTSEALVLAGSSDSGAGAGLTTSAIAMMSALLAAAALAVAAARRG